MEPLISVVIPCFNQARFLSVSIGSAVGQTHPNVEVLVVDDGSSDNTAVVCAAFPQARYLRRNHGGVSVTRNAGLADSRGDFIVFLDADDRLLPAGVEHGAGALIAKPEAAFALGRYRVITLDGAALGESHLPHPEADFYRLFLQRNVLGTTGAAMFRTSALREIGGFAPSINFSEDYDLYLRLARRFPIAVHDDVVSEYRRHGAGASENVLAILQGALSALRLQKEAGMPSSDHRTAYRRGIEAWKAEYGPRLADRLRTDWRARRWSRAAKEFVGLVRLYPRGIRDLVGC